MAGLTPAFRCGTFLTKGQIAPWRRKTSGCRLSIHSFGSRDMRSRFHAARGVVCLLAMVALSSIASAQDYRAKVQGLVADPSQASIVGAKVTLKNVNTGVADTKQTDSMGRYLFDLVIPGTYSVTVEAAGFQRFLQENVTVLTRGDVTVNATMTVGAVSETVTSPRRSHRSSSTPRP